MKALKSHPYFRLARFFEVQSPSLHTRIQDVREGVVARLLQIECHGRKEDGYLMRETRGNYMGEWFVVDEEEGQIGVTYIQKR